MKIVVALRALSNERRLQILEWLREPRKHFPEQVDGDLVEDGVCGLLIGILVLAKFPSSADWAIGLLVGIDLIFAGWTLTSVAMVGRDLSRATGAPRAT